MALQEVPGSPYPSDKDRKQPQGQGRLCHAPTSLPGWDSERAPRLVQCGSGMEGEGSGREGREAISEAVVQRYSGDCGARLPGR